MNKLKLVLTTLFALTFTFALSIFIYAEPINQGTTGNKTLTANYTPNNYTVTFNPNGGNTPSLTSKTVTYDSTYGTLPTCARTAYNFSGWYTDYSSGSQITTSTKVTITAPQFLYAHWSPVNYSITYNLNGGSGVSNRTYTIETTTFNLPIPTRSGYEFTGWTGSNGSTPQTTVTITKGITGDKSYTANWRTPTPVTTSDVPPNRASTDGRQLTNIVNFINNNRYTTQQICFQGDSSDNTIYVKAGSFTGSNPNLKTNGGTLIYSGISDGDAHDNFERAQTLANIINFILYYTKGSSYGTSSPMYGDTSGNSNGFNGIIHNGIYYATGYKNRYTCEPDGGSGWYNAGDIGYGNSATWW